MDEINNNLKNLTKQSKQVRLVVNFPMKDGKADLYAINLDTLDACLSCNGWLYAYIVHDSDIDKNGVLKTPHIHIVLKGTKRHELKYYIYYLADALNISENLISIQCSDDMAFDIQYLTHKNDSKKYQYNPEEISTNIDIVKFDELYNAMIDCELDTDTLIDFIRQSSNIIDLIRLIGIGRYEKFYRTISTLLKELARVGALPKSFNIY